MDSVTMEGKTSQVAKFLFECCQANRWRFTYSFSHIFLFFLKITKPREHGQNFMDNNTSKSGRKKIKAQR